MRPIDADVLLEKAWDADTRIGYVQVVDVGDILDAPTVELEQKGGKEMDDLISRQAAIEAVDEALTRVFVEHRDIAEKMINKIPSAQAERKKGKWDVREGELAFWDVCDQCGKKILHKTPFYKFCPNCGADMRGEEK